MWGAWPGEEPLKELLALLDGADFDGGGCAMLQNHHKSTVFPCFWNLSFSSTKSFTL